MHGTTPDWVRLQCHDSGVIILTMLADANPENRWIMPFQHAMHKAFDAIEGYLEANPAKAAALLTVSESPKFFSNGIDPTGEYTKALNLPEFPKSDHLQNIVLGMPGFIRPLQLPIPTIAAINGHAFGAGLMYAAAHDYRFQRADRGYMCAIEVEIGVGIPPPEMELFKHIMPLPAYYETVMGAKRWGAKEALQHGLIVAACPKETLFEQALAYAKSQVPLVAGTRKRWNYHAIKVKDISHLRLLWLKSLAPHRVSSC